MRILSVRPYYFRAFGDAAVIRFGDSITIFYGGNGSGKSSLAEALEWLLYGFTKRRRKGDKYSKNEYKGSYVHNACPPGICPYVEAEVRMPDGTTHTIRRTICPDDDGTPVDSESVFTIDGKAATDLSSLGMFYTEPQCPIVVQHGIQDFIHTRPIERYRVISEALGLADLIRFKDVLEKAKNQYRSNLPRQVTAAQAAVKNLLPKLVAVDLSRIGTRWKQENINIDADYQAILAKARELTGSPSEGVDDVLADVRKRQIEEMNRVFDISPYRPNSNLAAASQQVTKQLSTVVERHATLVEAAEKFASAVISRFTAVQLQFWKAGISLVKPDNPTECPFCEQSTVTPQLVAERRQRIGTTQNYSTLQTALDTAVDSYVAALTGLEQLVLRLAYQPIPNDKAASLRTMFRQGLDDLNKFAVDNQSGYMQATSLHSAATNAKTALTNLKTIITRPDVVLEGIKPVVDLPNSLEREWAEVKKALETYSKTFLAFEPVLQRELSDEKAVAKYTSLIDLLTSRSQVEIVARAKQFDGRILQAQRLADDYILAKQRDVLKTREKQILEWYDRLSPNPDVRFSGLEPGQDEFNLKAEAFGRQMNAAASLSQSQLNCLGLSVYIPSVTDDNSPFEFIVFDDPVQAMDDDHHDAFLIKVIPELLKTYGLQVVMLTHLQPTADRVRNLNYDRDPVYYKFDRLKADGPQIGEHVLLRNELKMVKDLACGNEDYRRLAVDRVRVLCEHIMRETFVKIKKAEVPAQFARGDPKTLLNNLFRTLPGVTPKQCQDLRDTTDWSDPSHHTDPDWQVPTTETINLHIDRLLSHINTLGLKK